MTRNSSARFLLAGDGLSAFGAWIDFLAILTLCAYQYQVTPYEMAIVSAAGLLPGILTASRIGKLCDGKNPKQLLLLSIVLRVLATGGILFCQEFVLFVVLVGLRSMFTAVAGPAINVMAVRSVGAAELPRFYSVLNVFNSTAKVIAPAIGTVSSSLASEAVALIMSAAFAAASLIAFAFVRVEPRPTAQTAANPLGGDAAAAVPSLLPLLWIAATYAFSVFMVNNLVPLVLQQEGLDKALLGVLVSCSGAGNILSGLWLARQAAAARLKARIADAVLPALMQAAGFAVVGVVLWAGGSQVPLVLPVLFFIIGTFSARFAIALNVYISSRYASAIGAVSGAIQAWQSSMIFVAPMIGAIILDRWGGPVLFWFSAAAAAVSFVALWAATRRLRGRLAGATLGSAHHEALH